jgi:hypothetical protein
VLLHDLNLALLRRDDRRREPLLVPVEQLVYLALLGADDVAGDLVEVGLRVCAAFAISIAARWWRTVLAVRRLYSEQQARIRAAIVVRLGASAYALLVGSLLRGGLRA